MIRCAERCLPLLLAVAVAACAPRPTRPPPPAPPPVAEEEPAAPEVEAMQARFDEALRLMRTGRSTEAVAAFEALARQHPEYSGPHTNLGILHARAGRRPQAIGDLSRAERANGDNLVALNWLALQYRETGQHLRAEAAWQRALQIAPDYAPAHLNLGILYDRHLNRPDDAVRHYRRYQQLVDGDELRVDVWVAEIEARGADRASLEASP